MKILAIETSCDDTGISVLDIKENKNSPVFTVLSNVVASQIEIGKKYGGVFPAMAKREHQKNLVPVLTKALKESKLLKIHPVIRQGALSNDRAKLKIKNTKFEILNTILEREPELEKKLIPFLKKYHLPAQAGKPDIDAIAITNGPGLEPCLWVGVNFAKALSFFWELPIIPVNHIEAHILVNYLDNPKINLPAISLIVSGGHTQIVLMGKSPSAKASEGQDRQYKIIGETRDDAAGECFDKCAKILGLGYPGGPEIAKLASQFNEQRAMNNEQIKLPRPMWASSDYDFSFSGLKTAVLYKDRDTKIKNIKYKQEMSAEVQQAIIDVLIKKTMRAVKDFGAQTLILGGGVSANQELRKQFKIQTDKQEIDLLVPPANLSTDNGLMIAVAGYFHKNKKIKWSTLEANANLRLE